MTDGLLLREVQEDFLLKKYSVVVVDEAHERSLNTDILLGLLSRVVRLRRTMADERKEERDEIMKDDDNDNDNDNGGDEVYPLKLIIMSATLRTEDFIGNETLFASKPPLVSVPARQYPVTVHFSKKTEMEDYVGVAAKKVEQIHNQLPPGGILVFLTGRREVDRMCRQVKQSLTPKMKGKKKKIEESIQQEEEVEELDVIGMDDGGGDAAEALDFDSRQQQDGGPSNSNSNDDRDDYELMEDVEDEEEVEIIGGQGFTADQIAAAEKEFEKRLGINLSSLAAARTKKSSTTSSSYDDGNNKINNEGGEGCNGHGISGVHVLPLYAALQPSAQAKVFQPTPPGHRLIIVATNVAETSLTIPGIRYVVDAGRSKQRLLESPSSGLARFDVRWISKASAEQRAGRAGRTGPGHCYRLFSSAVFNDMFPQHTPPEIKNTSLEGVALSLKSLGVDKVVNFPFPTPPEQAALKAAENCLVALGALHPQSLLLTALGKQMAAFPIGPRHARMLLAASKSSLSSSGSQSKANKRGVLPYAIALAAVMSVDSPFLSSMSSNDNDGTKEEDDRDDERQEEERRKTQAKKAQQAQGQFRLADSDALSALYALCAFETQGGGEAWCRKHHLHHRNLKEASALKKQLTRTVAASLSSLQPATTNNNINTTRPPPSTAALVALRHALTAGWCDSVARRVRSVDHINKKKSTGTADNTSNNGRMRAIRYRSAILEDEDIYLHPNSNLSSTAPEYVVYTELIRTTKRPYMAGVTAIEPQWLVHAVSAQQQQQEGSGRVEGSSSSSSSSTNTIYVSPLCQLGPPLSDPPPTYLPNKDQVVCWREVRYGKHDWLLPHYVALHPDVKERRALFAAALLEGKILPGMKRLKPALAMAASSCVKPEMRAHWRVAELLGALDRGGGVDSKAALREKWMQDPAFLRKELLSWIQKGTEAALLRMWESLKQEAMQ
jgi:ATP-dependent RNA helicase DHX37/DHR1